MKLIVIHILILIQRLPHIIHPWMDSDSTILHFHQQMELLGFIMNETLKSLVAIAMARGGASDLTAAQNANYFVTAASISQASPVTDVNRYNGTVNF